MNERPPIVPPKEEVISHQEQIAQPIPIEEWARQNNHEALLRYILSSDRTNRNVGLLREDMYYDATKKVMVLTVPYRTEWHQGHERTMQGGMPAVFMDTTSGALAFTEMPPGSGPLHKEGREIKHTPIVEHRVPLVVTCSFEEPPEDFKGPTKGRLFIKTMVTQGPNVCVESHVVVRAVAENLIDQTITKTIEGLDTWQEEQAQSK